MNFAATTMPSRKRNKGKERKAKKAGEEEKKRENVHKLWQGWARGYKSDCEMSLTKSIQCNHGCDIMIPDDPNHPICSLMDAFFTDCKDLTNMQSVLKLHPQVWHNSINRKVMINILVRMGANLLLSAYYHSLNNKVVSSVRGRGVILAITAITILENYNKEMSIDKIVQTRYVAAKFRDIRENEGCRDELKFLSKRISCSCLKQMYSEARKTEPKMGVCHHCSVATERSLLYVCSKCRIDQYCSRACQVAHWPKHEKQCVEYACIHSVQNKLGSGK